MLRVLCAVWAIILLVTGASAQDQYPSKPVTFIVPTAAGALVDLIARNVGQRLSQAWKQPVVIENKPGANTQIGATFVARAQPDGYTLLVAADATFVINPFLYSALRYDPVKEFAPITGLGRLDQALIVHTSVPAANLQELIALAKSKPGELTYGTVGAGSSMHLNFELMQKMGDFKLQAVHYRGGAPAYNDVLAGHISMMLTSPGPAAEAAEKGFVKFIATGGRQRHPQLPEIPTLAESGLTELEAYTWVGIVAPAGTPQAIIDKINNDVRQILSDPEFEQRFLTPNMLTSIGSSSREFAAFMEQESKKWRTLISASGIKID